MLDRLADSDGGVPFKGLVTTFNTRTNTYAENASVQDFNYLRFSVLKNSRHRQERDNFCFIRYGVVHALADLAGGRSIEEFSPGLEVALVVPPRILTLLVDRNDEFGRKDHRLIKAPKPTLKLRHIDGGMCHYRLAQIYPIAISWRP